jgi:hypothetical protein
MLEFRNPIPVITEKGEGMAIYVSNAGTFANDVWAVAMHDGRVLHFRSDQIRIDKNATFNIDPYVASHSIQPV